VLRLVEQYGDAAVEVLVKSLLKSDQKQLIELLSELKVVPKLVAKIRLQRKEGIYVNP